MKFKLKTDACNTKMSTMLLSKAEKDDRHMCNELQKVYINRERYKTAEKELYVIIWIIKKF